MKHVKTFESFLNEANDLSYWKDYADGSNQSPKWYSNDAKNPSAVNKLVDAVVNYELDQMDDKDADIDPSDMKALTDLAMKYFKKFGSINGHIVSAMLFQEANESVTEAAKTAFGKDVTKNKKLLKEVAKTLLPLIKKKPGDDIDDITIADVEKFLKQDAVDNPDFDYYEDLNYSVDGFFEYFDN